MFTVQKKFKKSFFVTIFVVFALHATPSYAVVEKPNLTPLIIVGGAGIAAFVTGTLLNPDDLYKKIEEKAIDAWIIDNHLNQFGEAKETVYQNEVTGPLLDGLSRIHYIKMKYIDEDIKPWRSGFVRILDQVQSLKSKASNISFGGLSVFIIALYVGNILHFQYTNAAWQEKIVGLKAESAELEDRFFYKIGLAVAEGVTKGLAPNNA